MFSLRVHIPMFTCTNFFFLVIIKKMANEQMQNSARYLLDAVIGPMNVVIGPIIGLRGHCCSPPYPPKLPICW